MTSPNSDPPHPVPPGARAACRALAQSVGKRTSDAAIRPFNRSLLLSAHERYCRRPAL